MQRGKEGRNELRRLNLVEGSRIFRSCIFRRLQGKRQSNGLIFWMYLIKRGYENYA